MSQIEESSISKRVEDFSLELIPNEVVYITIGVDTQDDRLEYSVLGWGLNQECYVLEHKILEGATINQEVWNKLEELITKEYKRKDKSLITVSATCIDSGGHSTLQVYEFATNQLLKGKKVYAIKGREGYGPVFEYRSRKSGKHRAHRYYFVSAGTTKESLFDRLKIKNPGDKFIHFSKYLSESYFKQLTCESPKWVIQRNGVSRKIWIQKVGTRREAPDCWRYGFSALYSDNEIAYKRICEDYQIRVQQLQSEKTETPQKSSYLEKFRYK